MAAFTLIDVDLFADELDLSCFTNNVTVDVTGAEVDATTMCSEGWTVPIVGRKSVMWSASGPTDMATATVAQTSAVDEILAVDIGSQYVLSAVPLGSSAGAVAYFTTGRLMSRTILTGDAGALATHNVEFKGNTHMVRGRVEHTADLTATGSSTGSQLGAVTSAQRVWAAVHFLTADGTTPSCTVKIQSDDNSGFSSATDRITFSAATAKGAQFSSTLGAIADDYWRATWVISGTSPVFKTRIMIGIQ